MPIRKRSSLLFFRDSGWCSRFWQIAAVRGAAKEPRSDGALVVAGDAAVAVGSAELYDRDRCTRFLFGAAPTAQVRFLKAPPLPCSTLGKDVQQSALEFYFFFLSFSK